MNKINPGAVLTIITATAIGGVLDNPWLGLAIGGGTVLLSTIAFATRRRR